MTTILNASTSSGLVATADNSGIIQLQTNGTNTINVATTGLTTIAYNGANAGLIPGQQIYVTNSGYVGSNSSSAQSIFGVGVTLSASTQYAFDMAFVLSKTAGTTSHTLALGFGGGTATFNNFLCQGLWNSTGSAFLSGNNAGANSLALNVTTSTVISGAQTSAALSLYFVINGIVSINAGGTFIPQYTLSAAPGGAYTTYSGSYMRIYPLAASGSNVSIGTWA